MEKKVLPSLPKGRKIKFVEVEAVFSGKDGSLGLRIGRKYQLYIFHSGHLIWIRWKDDKTGLQECCYESIVSFFQNWNNILVHKSSSDFFSTEKWTA